MTEGEVEAMESLLPADLILLGKNYSHNFVICISPFIHAKLQHVIHVFLKHNWDPCQTKRGNK